MNRLLKAVALFLTISSLGFVIYRSQVVMDRHRSIYFVDRSPVFLPRGEVLKWLSMGYRGLVADWLWIRCVLYYGRRVVEEDNPYFQYALRTGNFSREGQTLSKAEEESYVGMKPRHLEDMSDEMSGKPTYDSAPLDSVSGIRKDLEHLLYRKKMRGLVEHIYPMLDRVTTIDPHFVFPYIFGGVYVLLDTGDDDAALKLLEKGRDANEDRWEFHFYLGWVNWMYKGDMEKTRNDLLKAVGKKDCPDYVGDLLEGISKEMGKNELTRLYLEGLLESTDNPDIQERVKELIEKRE